MSPVHCSKDIQSFYISEFVLITHDFLWLTLIAHKHNTDNKTCSNGIYMELSFALCRRYFASNNTELMLKAPLYTSAQGYTNNCVW